MITNYGMEPNSSSKSSDPCSMMKPFDISSSSSCTCDICGVSESTDIAVPDIDQVGRVNAEVEWGQTLRLTKLNEKANFDASGPQIQTYKGGPKRRRKFRGEKPVILCDCHKHVVPVVEVKKIVDRRILNRKQHVNLLSQPRCLPTQNIEVVKIRKDTKCLPPRYIQMSVPLARRILENWKDYRQVYSPEQMTNLKKLLQKQDALTTQEANKYFKILASRRRKEKRKQGNLRTVCHRSSKAKKDIDRVVNEVIKYFIRKPSAQVKDRHYVITNEIINRVIDKKIGKHLKRSNKDVYSMTLYQIIDQISVWIDQKVDDIDTFDLDEEGDGEEESSCTSGSDSDDTDPNEIISNNELRALLEKNRKRDEPESGEDSGLSPESEGERMTIQSQRSKKSSIKSKKSQVSRVPSTPGGVEEDAPQVELVMSAPHISPQTTPPMTPPKPKKRKKRKKANKSTIKMMIEWDAFSLTDNKPIDSKSMKSAKSTKSAKSGKSGKSMKSKASKKSCADEERQQRLSRRETEEAKLQSTKDRIAKENKEQVAREKDKQLLKNLKKSIELRDQEENLANKGRDSTRVTSAKQKGKSKKEELQSLFTF